MFSGYMNTGRPNPGEQALRIALRYIMSGVGFTYYEIYPHIINDGVSPEGISPERFAAMVIQSEQWSKSRLAS